MIWMVIAFTKKIAELASRDKMLPSSDQPLHGEINKSILAYLPLSKKQLLKQFPPRFINKNKNFLYSLHSVPQTSSSVDNVEDLKNSSLEHDKDDEIVYCRYKAFPRPKSYLKSFTNTCKLVLTQGIFKYDEKIAEDENLVKHWYLNFSHSQLFVAWKSSLFAQDEMQVCEHPILGSLRECVLKKSSENQNLTPLTVQTNATPILIKNVDRKVSVNVNDFDLYGNKFSGASQELIRQATTVLDPITTRKSNILAIEAPTGGKGSYTLQDISYIFDTAYSGFRACKLETERDLCMMPLLQSTNCKTVIHTGRFEIY